MTIERNLRSYFKPREGTQKSQRAKKASYFTVVIPILAGIGLGVAALANIVYHTVTNRTGEKTKTGSVAQAFIPSRSDPFPIPRANQSPLGGSEKGGLIISTTGKSVNKDNFPGAMEFTDNGMLFPPGFDYTRTDNGDGTYTIVATKEQAVYTVEIGEEVTCKGSILNNLTVTESTRLIDSPAISVTTRDGQEHVGQFHDRESEVLQLDRVNLPEPLKIDVSTIATYSVHLPIPQTINLVRHSDSFPPGDADFDSNTLTLPLDEFEVSYHGMGGGKYRAEVFDRQAKEMYVIEVKPISVPGHQVTVNGRALKDS